MLTIAIMIFSFFGYILFYRLYGNFISRKIFALSDDNIPPSVAMQDDVDYVPTRKEIIFGRAGDCNYLGMGSRLNMGFSRLCDHGCRP